MRRFNFMFKLIIAGLVVFGFVCPAAALFEKS